MVSDFYSFAQILKTEFESKIKAELSRSLSRSLLLLAFLPLTINITTNQGNGCLTILKNGSVQLNQSLSSNPDNALNANFETLKEIYRSRDGNQFKRAENEGKIGISSYTPKGRMAERKIREFLGY